MQYIATADSVLSIFRLFISLPEMLDEAYFLRRYMISTARKHRVSHDQVTWHRRAFAHLAMRKINVSCFIPSDHCNFAKQKGKDIKNKL